MISSPRPDAGSILRGGGTGLGGAVTTGFAGVGARGFGAGGPWQPAHKNASITPAERVTLPARHTDKALAPQGAVQFADVRVVAGFHGAHDIHGRNVRPAEGAVVLDVLHARATTRDHAGQLGEAAGPIADRHCEPRHATIVHETLLDHAAKHGGIDVPATD